MLSTTELIEYIDFLDHNGQNANEYEVALWTKLATPIASIVMLVLAVPFALGNQRDASRGKRIFTGMILTASFVAVPRSQQALPAFHLPQSDDWSDCAGRYVTQPDSQFR